MFRPTQFNGALIDLVRRFESNIASTYRLHCAAEPNADSIVTIPQLLILRALHCADCDRVALEKVTGMKRMTVHELLLRMTRDGLIKPCLMQSTKGTKTKLKTRGPAPRQYKIAKKGEIERVRADELMKGAEREVLAGLAPIEESALRKLLMKLANA